MNEQTNAKQHNNDTISATGFKELGLSEKRCKALKKKGFTAPTPIQERIIDVFNTTEDDIIGISQTGSGKTASFGLPILDKVTGAKKTPTGHHFGTHTRVSHTSVDRAIFLLFIR